VWAVRGGGGRISREPAGRTVAFGALHSSVERGRGSGRPGGRPLRGRGGGASVWAVRGGGGGGRIGREPAGRSVAFGGAAFVGGTRSRVRPTGRSAASRTRWRSVGVGGAGGGGGGRIGRESAGRTVAFGALHSSVERGRGSGRPGGRPLRGRGGGASVWAVRGGVVAGGSAVNPRAGPSRSGRCIRRWNAVAGPADREVGRFEDAVAERRCGRYGVVADGSAVNPRAGPSRSGRCIRRWNAVAGPADREVGRFEDAVAERRRGWCGAVPDGSALRGLSPRRRGAFRRR
jgi:hypothetical protein